MRVLIIARCKNGRYAPFITEQVKALEKLDIEFQYFDVRQKGVWGYLKLYPKLLKTIREFRPDIVHAHYGLCGVLANLQRKVPVVTTFHGSDINNSGVLKFSRFAIRHSRFNVFVSQQNVKTVLPQKDYALIPCGITLEDYPVMDKIVARKEMGLDKNGKYVLFAGAFDNPIKNAPLAQAAVALVPGVDLMELKGYSRHQVALLMYAADSFLMTSFSEGSPQVIKEALACGCPIVSVDVGDVKDQISGLKGCIIAERNDTSIAQALVDIFSFQGRTEGRKRIEERHLTNDEVARRVKDVYSKVSSTNYN